MLDKVSIDFPYTKLAVKPFPGSKRQSIIYRPIIPVTITYKKKLVVFQTLIDSGADYNIFHGDIAAYLGINLTKGSKKNISGLSGGKIKGYTHKVHLKINQCYFPSEITFSNQIPDNALAVLGNKGFFNKFKVTFNLKELKINLKRN